MHVILSVVRLNFRPGFGFPISPIRLSSRQDTCELKGGIWDCCHTQETLVRAYHSDDKEHIKREAGCHHLLWDGHMAVRHFPSDVPLISTINGPIPHLIQIFKWHVLTPTTNSWFGREFHELQYPSVSLGTHYGQSYYLLLRLSCLGLVLWISAHSGTS